MNWKYIAGAAAILLLCSCADEETGAPMAEKKPIKLEIHGDVRIDDYFWLRERDNPDVISYLDAENTYTDSVLEPVAGLQKQLIAEMAGRIKDQDVSAPYRDGDYYYYYRYEPGAEYPVYCRRKGSLEAAEQILLDVNAEAGDEDYFAVRGFQVSPDHRVAAYGVDTVGRRFYDLYFIDLETGEKLQDSVADVTSNFVWANDSKTIFYTRQHRETLRWQEIYRHEVGTDEHKLVFEEADETFDVWVYKSLSERHVYITSTSTLATEVRFLDADKPADDFAPVLLRESEHEYFVSDGGDRFYILSNDGARNFQLLETPLGDTAKESWSVVVPHRDDVLIEDFEVFSDHVVLEARRDGMTRLEVLDRGTGQRYEIEFDEEVFDVAIGDNYEFDSGVLRYDYESMTTPESVYDYDLSSHEHSLIKEDEVVGSFSRDDYHTERLLATARDGTRIPVSIVYRKDLELSAETPLLQYGYGSYGSSIDPGFDAERLSLLDRGFVYAIAHIRGGAELGRQWYYDGRQLKKKNTFTDFIDVSKFLIAQGYTSSEHLYASGGSAGGLLMGAVLNMAPELYRGVVTRVPFVDVVTTMLDASIPLTSSEWDEWGDPREKEYYDYILSYSPYDQVTEQAYPNILITTALHDSQVQYWEPAKWVAKLRDKKTDDNLLLLKTDMEAGHSGKTGRYQSLEDTAIYYTFLLYLEGIRE